MLHLRHIRSFVSRGGRMSSGQRRKLDQDLPRYLIPYSPNLVDFAEKFGRLAPLHLEIGFGHGEALAKRASEHPEINFVGIEVFPPGIAKMLLQINRLGLANVRLLDHDAVFILKHMIPPQSVSEICIFFPDPWPKRRHHKRRLIQPAFVRELALCLAPHGRLNLATDWEDYARHMEEVITPHLHLTNKEIVTSDNTSTLAPTFTHFAKRASRLGHKIFYFSYCKNEHLGLSQR